MPKICYVNHKFNKKTDSLLQLANRIIADYAVQGFDLTLRQLYYQMVSRDIIPNNQSEYKKLGQIVSDARRAGVIDWDAIIDRTRNLRANSHWDTPADILLSAEQSFQIDKWAGQKYRPEVWVEKDALVGVVERACKPLDISFFACRGYSSDSEMWRASQRCIDYDDKGQRLYIIHLGDHDPSGIDMSRDIKDRFNLFESYPLVKRIALNFDQVQQYNPPPNPAKETDSRWQGYVDEYGVTDSWELDALEPQVIVDLITDQVVLIRDDDLWYSQVKKEKSGKAALKEMRLNYNGKAA
jgi:hypothetical protein